MRSVLALAGVLLLTAPVYAASNSASIDVELFQPAPGGTNFFTTQSGEVNAHLALSFGGSLNYGRNLLQVLAINPGNNSQQTVGGVVKNRIQLDAMAAIGLFGRFEVGLVLPLVWESGFDSSNFVDANVNLGTHGLRAVTQGDLRLVPKVNLVNVNEGLFALAVVPEVRFPTAVFAPFAGEGSVNFTPMLAMSSHAGPVRVGLDLGFRVRKPATIATVTIGNEYLFKGAVALDMSFGGAVPVELVGEVFGATQANHPFGLGTSGNAAEYQKAGTPVEGDLGVRVTAGSYIFTVGGGGGFTPGYGAPLPRVFISTSYYTGKTVLPDADNDGVPDEADKCPDKPEDKDGYQDEDGCPDLDNDKDGVLDEDDQCPMEPEDKDGFQDEDGCPDLDNDADGIPDSADKCPLDAEDKDGFQDTDGCPDLDNDGDGLPDALDTCPSDAEDMDGFQDDDGCPDLDNDGDGLPDLNDLCPNFAEDKDGVADDDGCPEDNDNDGIADDKDKCPNEAETYNGIKDDDGCPEALEKKSLVKVTEEKIEIKDSVFFKPNSAVIQSRSFEMLNQVAAVLRNYLNITKLRIEGHTDNQGNRKKNIKLSQDRAEAVRQYFIRQGVAGNRLEAKGYGPDKPIASNGNAAGREKNRRVEFVIAEMKPMGQEVKQAPASAPVMQLNVPAAPPAPAAPPPTSAPAPFLDINAAPAQNPATEDAAPKKGKKGKKGKKEKQDDVKFDF